MSFVPAPHESSTRADHALRDGHDQVVRTDSVSTFLLRSTRKQDPTSLAYLWTFCVLALTLGDSRTTTRTANGRVFQMARQKIQVSLGHLAAERDLSVGIWEEILEIRDAIHVYVRAYPRGPEVDLNIQTLGRSGHRSSSYE